MFKVTRTLTNEIEIMTARKSMTHSFATVKYQNLYIAMLCMECTNKENLTIQCFDHFK